jgi:hypothetical protein
MNDVHVLEAIDAALSGPAFCTCGEYLTIAVHDRAAWLECPAFARPTGLPIAFTAFRRALLHDRRLVVEMPAPRPPRSRAAMPVRDPVRNAAAG